MLNDEKNLREFIFNAFLLEDSLESLENNGITTRVLGESKKIQRILEIDFSPRIINDANKMSGVYMSFFCIENAIRELISDRLSERKGLDWWENSVPEKVKKSVEKLIQKEEKNKYHTPRSTTKIGYTMFGNLGDIIIYNWDDFSDLFPDQAWISSRFNDLEMSRNIIMHTGILPDIEIERIQSIVRDWLRQVG